ncbi:MAG: NmrA family NAD(P)-binding protein [Phycisphaerae bacterium]|nr:NmrA family NAD(P)-binding protein [Phycisphaerae bacterium]
MTIQVLLEDKAMEAKKTILVVGATGAQGGSVARHLLAGNTFQVRCLTRHPDSEKARALRQADAEIVQGDLEDAASRHEGAARRIHASSRPESHVRPRRILLRELPDVLPAAGAGGRLLRVRIPPGRHSPGGGRGRGRGQYRLDPLREATGLSRPSGRHHRRRPDGRPVRRDDDAHPGNQGDLSPRAPRGVRRSGEPRRRRSGQHVRVQPLLHSQPTGGCGDVPGLEPEDADVRNLAHVEQRSLRETL